MIFFLLLLNDPGFVLLWNSLHCVKGVLSLGFVTSNSNINKNNRNGMIFFLLLLNVMAKQDSASLFYSKLLFTVHGENITEK